MSEEMRYIVKESQIANAVEGALVDEISNEVIVDELMRSIKINLSTVLEDDCENITPEMFSNIVDMLCGG